MSQIKGVVDKDFSSERLSFIQLIKKYSVVIPVIQRDYAQGRKTEKPTKVRKDFVNNLILYLQAAEGEIHNLDFVYGTVVNGEFIPLDGQQRLTTLFLLHLYVACKSGKYNEFVNLMKSGERYRFEYKTRKSSTMFCERLLTNQVIMPNVEKDKTDEDTFKRNDKSATLQEVIKDKGWFFYSWLNDPTVAGMLVMLNEIDSQFSEIKDFDFEAAYERLFGDKAPVTFQMLPLNGYNRTDDLYIKLNARGIHLTDFENFKARLEDWMKCFVDDCELSDFKKKVDGKWNDYLWQYRNGKDNTDHIMENLFRNFIAFSYRPVRKTEQSNEAFKKQVNGTMSYLLEQNDKKMRFSFSQYSELGVMPKEGTFENERSMIKKVISFFDIYCAAEESNEELRRIIRGNWLNIDEFITSGEINKKATYSQRLRFYAYLQYRNIHRQIDDYTDFAQWMRLIRNLDCATDIDTAGDFYEALVSIDDVLVQIGEKKVLDWLATVTAEEADKVEFFRKRQMKEERIKARLLIRESEVGGNSIKEAVELGDTNDYLKGQIGFALEFAGVYEKFANNLIACMNESDIQKLGKDVSVYIEKTKKVVELLSNGNNKTNGNSQTRLFERALLTLGMYLRQNSANRYNFCNILSDPYNSLKTMLFVEKDNRYCREIFKSLLDKIEEDICADFQNIIDNREKTKIPEWRNIIIDNPSLIDYCRYGFLYITGDPNTDDVDNVILFGASQMNHYHAELWTRALYENIKSKYHCVEYREQKRFDVDSVIYRSFTFEDSEYEFRLSHKSGKWEYKVVDVNDNEAVVDWLNIADNSSGEQILIEALKLIETKELCTAENKETSL